MRRPGIFERLISRQDSSHRGNPLFIKDRTRERRRQGVKYFFVGIIGVATIAALSIVYVRGREKAAVDVVFQGLLDTPTEELTTQTRSYAEERTWTGRRRIESKLFDEKVLKGRLEALAPITVQHITRESDRKILIDVADNVMAVVVEGQGWVSAIDGEGREVYRLTEEEYASWQQTQVDTPRLARMNELPRVRLQGDATLATADAHVIVTMNDVLRHSNIPIQYFTKNKDGSGSVVSTVNILIDYTQDPQEQADTFLHLWNSFDDTTRQSVSYVDIRFGRRVYYK